MCKKEVVEDIGVSLSMKKFENSVETIRAIGPFSLPRSHIRELGSGGGGGGGG